MPHFKDKDNGVHWLDSAENVDYLLPSGCVEITETEADALINTPPTILEERAGMLVSRFQARAALHGAAMLAGVESLMQDPATDPIVVIAWQDATTFKRLSPAVISIGASLGITDTELDDLFRAAALLEI